MGHDMNCHMFSAAPNRQNGSAMIYILVAIVLLAALSFTLSNQSSQTGSEPLGYEKLLLQVSTVQQLSSAARASIDTMRMAGSDIDDLVFIAPDQAGYANDTIHNLYHPNGGGLEYRAKFSAEACVGGASGSCRIVIDRHMDMEGTPTTAQDVVLYIHHLKEDVCGAVNLKINGKKDIPQVSVPLASIFIDGADLTGTNCPDCEDLPSACVTDGTVFGFYSLLAPQ